MIIATSLLLTGCTTLTGLNLGGPPKLDPNRVYLDGEYVRLMRYSDVQRYACLGGPLWCEHAGVGWDCRCP